jgi:hypothetical protein
MSSVQRRFKREELYYFGFLFFLVLIFLQGCGRPNIQAPSPGALQVTRAGRLCSFWTSVFNGPKTARGRNEGYLKSKKEIKRLIPIYNIPTIIDQGKMADAGMSLSEYLDRESRCSMNLNKYPDVLQTITVCEHRGIISPQKIKALRRHLAQCNFLNADTLIEAVKNDALTYKEGRLLFFQWLMSIGNFKKVNLYLFVGNGFMLRKLHINKIISKDEARHFLQSWIFHLERFDTSFLEDLEYFQAISPADLDVLIERENCLLRQKLIEHNAAYVIAGYTGDIKVRLNNSRIAFNQLKDKLKNDIVKLDNPPDWFH